MKKIGFSALLLAVALFIVLDGLLARMSHAIVPAQTELDLQVMLPLILGDNPSPVVIDDEYELAEDTVLVLDAANGVLANDSGPNLKPLQAVLVGDVSNGELKLNADGSFEYIPDPNFNGIDSFMYKASDGVNISNLASATLTVNPINDAPQIVSGQIAFTKQVIGTGVDQTHTVLAADLNRDGFVDVVATDYVDDSVFWYENDGSGNFLMRLLDDNLDGAYPAHVGDVDLDGDVDVLAAGYLADTFVWYENDGNGGFTRRNIDTATDGAHSIVTGDMDQDGDVDLLTSSQDAGNIAWYENDGLNNFTRYIIDTSALGAKRAEFADVDGDGDMDVFSASYDVDEVAWHENDGNQVFNKHIITASANGAYFVTPADVDGDGDEDVLSASRINNTIAWYENDGGGSFSSRNPIDTSALGARTVIAADVDGDGDLDAVTASVGDDSVAWYENDGNGGFLARGIDLSADGAYGVFAIDMDDDGDLDVLSASRDANEVALYPHFRAHQISMDVGGTLVIDDTVLLTVDLDDQPDGLIYTITTAPASGELELNGVPLVAGGMFTQDDLNNSLLAYVHNGFDASPDGFTFTVQDGGEDGIRPTTGTFTIYFSGAGDVIAHLPLDEGTGTLAGDLGGFGNDGTLVNGATFEADSGDGSPFSADFDGVDDYIDLGLLDVNGSGLTLATWFKANSFPGPSDDPRLISKSSGSAANDHVFTR